MMNVSMLLESPPRRGLRTSDQGRSNRPVRDLELIPAQLPTTVNPLRLRLHTEDIGSIPWLAHGQTSHLLPGDETW